ncbi:MFS transporter [bacterium]|nr:MFS transporter [bacterium]
MQSPPSISARLERLPITNYQRIIFAVIASAWFFDCVDVATMTFILSSIKKEFALAADQAGAVASMSFLGMFLGAGLSGLLADRFGRCVVFRWSIMLWGLASLACAFAPSVEVLMFTRVLLGIGMAMELPVGQSLVCEYIPAPKRGTYVALLEGAWPAGFIAAGVLAHFILPVWGWRGAFIAEAIPALIVLIIRRIVPESPRWLYESGRVEEAEAVMTSIESKVKAELKTDELPTPKPEPEQGNSISNQERSHPFIELFKGEYRKRTIMVWTLWFFALLGYYGLTTWLGALLESKGFTMAKSTNYITLISLAGIPGFITAAILVESWGRKPMMITTLLGSALMAYFYGTADSVPVIIGFGLAMQFFMFGMWSVLYAYTPELYPTHARATGAGFASSIGRVGALIGPVVVGMLLSQTGQPGVFALAAGSFVIAAMAVALLGKETKGLTLEEI